MKTYLGRPIYARLTGGVGNMRGTLLAVLVLQVVLNGLALVGWSSAVQALALGVVLVLVLLDQSTPKLRG